MEKVKGDFKKPNRAMKRNTNGRLMLQWRRQQP